MPPDPLQLVPRHRQGPRSLLLPGVAVVVLLTLLLALADEMDSAFNRRFQAQLVQVQTAALSYYTEYGRYPAAPDNATLIKILTGASAEANERRIQFLSVKPSELSANGELLGPSGTPVRFSVTTEGRLRVRSAGPDKVFGTWDDVTVEDDLHLSH